jgi:hypothetical protein
VAALSPRPRVVAAGRVYGIPGGPPPHQARGSGLSPVVRPRLESPRKIRSTPPPRVARLVAAGAVVTLRLAGAASIPRSGDASSHRGEERPSAVPGRSCSARGRATWGRPRCLRIERARGATHRRLRSHVHRCLSRRHAMPTAVSLAQPRVTSSASRPPLVEGQRRCHHRSCAD